MFSFPRCRCFPEEKWWLQKANCQLLFNYVFLVYVFETLSILSGYIQSNSLRYRLLNILFYSTYLGIKIDFHPNDRVKISSRFCEEDDASCPSRNYWDTLSIMHEILIRCHGNRYFHFACKSQFRLRFYWLNWAINDTAYSNPVT